MAIFEQSQRLQGLPQVGRLLRSGTGISGRVRSPSAAPSSSGVSFSDNFNRADAATLGANWTALAGTVGIVSNQAVCTNGSYRQSYSATNTNTISQYVKVTLTSNPDVDYMGVLFRVSDDGSNYYTVYAGGGSVNWESNGGGIGSTIFNFDSGDTLAVTVTGTGSSTEVRVWRNASGDAPTSASLWGGAAPDITFTNDPATPADTGTRTGLSGFSLASATYDDFFGGDIP